MGKGKRYTKEYKEMIIDAKEIKINENEIITMKEFKELKKQIARIQEENEILHQRRTEPKKLWPYLQHKNSCFNSSH